MYIDLPTATPTCAPHRLTHHPVAEPIMAVLAVVLLGALSASVQANTAHEIFIGRMSGSAMFFNQEVVKDAPFSATATTRSVQQLVDGNRIINEDKTRIRRDSAGRVRRESIGNSHHHDITISDPANKRSWMLTPGSQTAVQMPMGFDFLDADHIELPDMSDIAEGLKAIKLPADIEIELDGDVQNMVAAEIAGALENLPAEIVMIDQADLAIAGMSQAQVFPSIAGSTLPMNQGTTETRPLGQKTLSGVRVEGTLHTTTIPAGAIGNEAPIVSKRTTWYAPELRLMMSTEETDPRFGTISYTVTIDSQSEPDAELFEVPDDYRVLGSSGDQDARQ